VTCRSRAHVLMRWSRRPLNRITNFKKFGQRSPLGRFNPPPGFPGFGELWRSTLKIDKRIIAHRIENSGKANQFVSLAKAIMLGDGRMLDTIDAGCLPEKLANIVRSGVPAGTVDGQDSTATPDAWGSALTEYQSLANAWVESLSTAGAYDKILSSGAFVRVPMRQSIRLVSTGATGYSPAELEATPLTALELDSAQLEPRQSVAMVAVTKEVLQRGDTASFNLLAAELKKAVALETDRSFTESILSDSNVQSTSSTGVSEDIESAVVGLATSSNARIHVIGPSFVIKSLAMLRNPGGKVYDFGVNGGVDSGVTYIATDALTDDVIILDAAQCAANSDTVLLDSSEHATLQLSDTPTDGASNGTSMWQSNMRALRARRFWAFHLLRPAAAFVVTDVSGITA